MGLVSSVRLNQIGLVLGFIGTIVLAFSGKVGVISKGGFTEFTGLLDPMDPVDDKLRRVRASHWRNRYFTPAGWALLEISFLAKFVATFG